MIQHIDHIGIAVHSLQEAIPLFERIFGTKCQGTETVESQGVRTAFFQLGEASIELLEPLNEGAGAVGTFLAKRGQGIHHLALSSDDVAADLARVGRDGARLIDEVPRDGAGGKRVAFVHPKSAAGVLVELCERRTPSDDSAEADSEICLKSER